MKLPKTHFTKLLWLGAIAGLVSQASSSASTLYWTGKTSTGNDAAWDTSKINWSATSPGVTGDVAFTNGDDVIFSSPLANTSGNTISLSGEVTLGSMTFRRESGSAVAFTLNGGTLHMPATITQSGGSNASGNVAINSSMVLSGNLTIEGNNAARLTLGGQISGTGDIILNDAKDFRVSNNTNTFDGTFYLNGGQWVLSNVTNRIVGAGPRTFHIGDGTGNAETATAVLNGNSSTAGLTTADDSFTLKSDGAIQLGGRIHDGKTGLGLIFDGGGVIYSSTLAAAATSFKTSGITVLSGIAIAEARNTTYAMTLDLTATAGFNIASGATFKLGSQYSKQTPATFITKTGGGTVEVTGALQTASTGFRIEEGKVVFKTGFTLPGTTSVDLAGGTLGAENVDLTLQGLTLSANSALDFGSVDGVDLLFTGSVSLGNYQLSIANFDSAAGDTLRFWDGSNVTITSEQAAQFQFGGGTHGAIDANGYITVVPEPSTYACLGLGMLLMSRFLRRSKA